MNETLIQKIDEMLIYGTRRIKGTNKHIALIDKYYVIGLVENYDKQLQAYKDKEDKLRKILGNYRHHSYPTKEQQYENEDIVNSAYEILNEGGK